jgi:hypothetical protein
LPRANYLRKARSDSRRSSSFQRKAHGKLRSLFCYLDGRSRTVISPARATG